MKPTLAAPIGPWKGTPVRDSAAEAPIIAAISEENSSSEEITVDIIWTSFLNSSGNSGLIGLSINLDVSVSFSVGLASLLKYPPGIFPAA